MSNTIRIKVKDITSLTNTLNPKVQQAVQASIMTSLAVIKDKWVFDIQHTLNSSRPLYLMGLDISSIIYPYNLDYNIGAIELHGKLPNMIEQGTSAWNMKLGFMQSNRVKPRADGTGWYLTIPMRHSVPGSFMYGAPLPDDIYKQAKALQNREYLKINGGLQTSWTGYQHKANIYDGLTRIIKTYQNPVSGKLTKQSQYFTFRRVSDKSDILSWWHPGFVGVKEAEKLMPFATKTFIDNLEDNISSII